MGSSMRESSMLMSVSVWPSQKLESRVALYTCQKMIFGQVHNVNRNIILFINSLDSPARGWVQCKQYSWALASWTWVSEMWFLSTLYVMIHYDALFTLWLVRFPRSLCWGTWLRYDAPQKIHGNQSNTLEQCNWKLLTQLTNKQMHNSSHVTECDLW